VFGCCFFMLFSVTCVALLLGFMFFIFVLSRFLAT